jgi:hypothetical protein
VPDILCLNCGTRVEARAKMAFEKDRACLAASAFRFIDELPAEELATLWTQLHSDELPVAVNRQKREMMLAETAPRYAINRKHWTRSNRFNR